MTVSQRIEAFSKLGLFINQFSHHENIVYKNIGNINEQFYERFAELISSESLGNNWFIEKFIRKALSVLATNLEKNTLLNWTNKYPEIQIEKRSKNIGVVMAGNIPLVGFHDFVCVLLSGNVFVGKLSSKDDKLFRIVCEILIFIDNDFIQLIYLENEPLTNKHKLDAIIATGSDNTARYFEYYFGKYPNIIRRNRNSVALISGTETSEEIKNLADDIFMYFGLGCRNVSKIYLPTDFDITKLFPHFESYEFVAQHHSYNNNYDYQKAIMLVNKIQFFDTGFSLFTQNPQLASPISVVYYEFYEHRQDLISKLQNDIEKIQCIVANQSFIDLPFKTLNFGTAQNPSFEEYADNVDVMQFLNSL